MYDIDTEQSQARYDPRLLSEDLTNYHSSYEGAPCINSNSRYIHGQKVCIQFFLIRKFVFIHMI